MRKWAAANLREIRDDRSLSLYGSALALVNLVVAVFWLRSEPIGLILAPGNPPVCWPFFPDCHNARVLSPATTELIVRLLGALAIVNVWLFAVGKNVKSAFWLLAFLTALKFTLIAQDFRLIHNQHYMAGWATFCYLFVPHKRLVLKLLIVTFYVWAGMLKLNDDWLSGAALHGRHPLGLPATLVPASCAYVVVLEIVLVWGVLSRRVLIFWASWLQLALFHISSFWVVGYFYPLVMFPIISLFVLERTLGGAMSESAMRQGRSSWTSATAVLAVFAMAQTTPRLYPGDSALTGQGRMFAIHMFDALVTCESTLTFRSSTAETTVRMRPQFTYPRIACDPLVYFQLARAECRARRIESPGEDFDLLLRSRAGGVPAHQTVVDIPRFCASGTSYSVFGNEWIKPVRRGQSAAPAGAQQTASAVDAR